MTSSCSRITTHAPRASPAPLRYRRAVIESTTNEAGCGLDRDFTISLWAEVPRGPGRRCRRSRGEVRSRLAHRLHSERDLERRAATTGRATSFASRSGSTPARAALVRPRPAVTDLELRQQLPHRVRRIALRGDHRMPPPRPTGVTSTATSARPQWEDLGQVGSERRARRRAADRPRRRALRRDLELRLDARPRRGARALPRLPLRRPGPLGGLRAAGRSRRLFSLASYRGDLSRSATTRTVHAHRGGADLGAGDGVRHVRASR